MREFSTPLTIEVPTSGNLTDDVVRNAAEAPTAAVLSRYTDEGWVDVSAQAFLEQVTAVAKGLVALGVKPGDRVALVSRTRYEWTLVDYATWFAGAVTVPVYETSSAEQLAWVLEDCGATVCVVETPEHVARVESVRDRLGERLIDQLRDLRVLCLDQDAVSTLVDLGVQVSDDDIEQRRTSATPGDLATLIYTSGTTGRPRGCRLTHGNFMSELEVAVHELDALFAPDDDGEAAATLLFLPLAHVFARIIQVGCIRARVRLGHTSDVRNLGQHLRDFRPTFVLAVPRVFEKLFNTASQHATADGRGGVFERAAETAIAYSRALDRGRGRVPIRLRARHAFFSRIVYGRLREGLGGRCDYAISGGAPLGERLGHFYRGIGITVLEGYGLTESTAALTVNLPETQKIGSVGRPLPGTAVRVADDGELLVRGHQVFDGYWNDDDATRAVLDPDGWLHTGDVGEVDDEGFVRIAGRKKEILVTAGGKNVAPAVLEDRLRAHPLVSQALVVGDRQPFVAALVTIDEDAFPAWAHVHGKPLDVAALIEDPDLRAEVQHAVDDANTAVSKAESIRRFRVLPHDWTEEGGQLTPSLKLKRNVVMREHRSEIAALYR